MQDVRPFKSTERRWPENDVAPPGLSLNETGLVVAAKFVLAPFSTRRAIEIDPDRLLALLSVGYRRPIAVDVLQHIEAAGGYWEKGDKALANFRLLFVGLPHLDQPSDTPRLRLAESILDAGLSPYDLLKHLDIDTIAFGVRKYDPKQPRVPSGSGKESGRWASIWHGIGDWLEEPVPEYDQDTGTQVGTRTRGRAIATNPLTSIGVAATALVAAQAVVAEGAVAAVEAASPVIVEEIGIAANAIRGLASEARVLEELGLVKNTKAIVASEGRSIPDVLTNTMLLEIKDVAYISSTRQLRIQAEAAHLTDRMAILVTGERTKISKRVLELFDEIWHHEGLGPK